MSSNILVSVGPQIFWYGAIQSAIVKHGRWSILCLPSSDLTNFSQTPFTTYLLITGSGCAPGITTNSPPRYPSQPMQLTQRDFALSLMAPASAWSKTHQGDSNVRVFGAPSKRRLPQAEQE